ncbi:hypothetical protein [Serratia ficaria]|uniref:hypothetical protein n=1 Tax=Serratia ficaria TaxID=61651 RepID=UPI00217AEF16|nr:hypothetical protein [Serratia ficaria]CAI1507918.1 Uncharacterised protein [Serratia ficaria]
MNQKTGYILPGVSASSLARCALIKRLGYYGFIECAQLVNFLQLICDDEPGMTELKYLRDKVQDCLQRHGTRDDYFTDLRRLHRELSNAVIYHFRTPL